MERAAKVGQAPQAAGSNWMDTMLPIQMRLAYDDVLLFWATPSGDVPARRDVESRLVESLTVLYSPLHINRSEDHHHHHHIAFLPAQR